MTREDLRNTCLAALQALSDADLVRAADTWARENRPLPGDYLLRRAAEDLIRYADDPSFSLPLPAEGLYGKRYAGHGRSRDWLTGELMEKGIREVKIPASCVNRESFPFLMHCLNIKTDSCVRVTLPVTLDGSVLVAGDRPLGVLPPSFYNPHKNALGDGFFTIEADFGKTVLSVRFSFLTCLLQLEAFPFHPSQTEIP